MLAVDVPPRPDGGATPKREPLPSRARRSPCGLYRVGTHSGWSLTSRLLFWMLAGLR
jgi:hypothetical protein